MRHEESAGSTHAVQWGGERMRNEESAVAMHTGADAGLYVFRDILCQIIMRYVLRTCYLPSLPLEQHAEDRKAEYKYTALYNCHCILSARVDCSATSLWYN